MQAVEYDRAMKDYNTSLRLNPSNEAAYNGRGVIWYLKGRLERAIVDFSNALRIDPYYAQAYFNRANAWVKHGSLKNARIDIEKALRLKPGMKDYQHLAGYLKSIMYRPAGSSSKLRSIMFSHHRGT